MADYIAHHGILGMKWGVRRFQNKDGTRTPAGKKREYKSIGLRSYIARKQNEKVDRSFKKWKENSTKKEDAVALGKKANQSRMAFEDNRKDKAAKAQYKSDRKAYKKALNANTTYRKGAIRGEVGSDLSRKYLSKAKQVDKQLRNDPGNKDLQKKYNSLMSAHDVERAKARKAPAVGAARSRRIASLKRGATIAAKTAVASAVISAGVYALNRYGGVNVSTATFNGALNLGKTILKNARYIY